MPIKFRYVSYIYKLSASSIQDVFDSMRIFSPRENIVVNGLWIYNLDYNIIHSKYDYVKKKNIL